MQKSNQSPPKSGLGVQDILYVLYHHKGKIIGLSLLGFAAAAIVYLKQEPIYKSESKLLIRYVLQRGSAADPFEMQQTPGNNHGDPVVNTEIELLTSVDLAKDVAEAVGPNILLPEAGGQATANDAAGVVLGNLEVSPGHSPNVLRVLFGSKNRDLPQGVLEQIVECYFRKHLEIHRSAAAFDEVAKEASEAKERLRKTEETLNKLRSESGIMSLTDATSALSAQRTKTQEELLAARAELAEKKASLGELDQENDDAPTTGGTLAANDPETEPAAEEAPPQVVTEYRSVLEIIGFLQKRDLELRVKFKPGNRLIALNRQQLDNNDSRRRALEQRYPGLVAKAAALVPGSQLTENPQDKLIGERARIAAIQAKIDVLNAHLKEIGAQFSSEYALGARIEALQRQLQADSEEFRSLDTNLKNARIDQTLDPSRMPNITIMQQPSEPVITFDPLTQKIILGLAGSGIALGLGLAFLIELLFDRRVKRPIEIQTRLQLPLLLSIPYLGGKARGRFLLSGGAADLPLLPGGGGESEEVLAMVREGPKGALSRSEHFILPYAETLRDRIIFNFEINNVVHKPKFVAVTGLSERAGTSTIAAGLAKSFSEIKGAKVLLVDLSSMHPEENPIYGEMPLHSLHGALELTTTKDFENEKEKLYYASAVARRDETGLTSFTPIQLYELMPHLQASAYDYIVFDMPSLNETSRTLAMAGMMDKVLLVLDAENTSRDTLKWGYSELVKGKADVSCIFNKTRTHAPTWLVGEN
jgi:uncharacterized protein involved in exopolysaccharide biosynthesis/Mrp family chromosome partitioning ATPase